MDTVCLVGKSRVLHVVSVLCVGLALRAEAADLLVMAPGAGQGPLEDRAGGGFPANQPPEEALLLQRMQALQERLAGLPDAPIAALRRSLEQKLPQRLSEPTDPDAADICAGKRLPSALGQEDVAVDGIGVPYPTAIDYWLASRDRNGALISGDSEEWLATWRLWFCIRELQRRGDVFWVEWMARRANELPPTNLDMLSFASAFPQGETSAEFWAETSDMWRKMLAGRNPVYRLLALFYGRHFLAPAEVLPVYKDGLAAPDVFTQALSVWGVEASGDAGAADVLMAYSARLEKSAQFPGRDDLVRVADEAIKRLIGRQGAAKDYIELTLWKCAWKAYGVHGVTLVLGSELKRVEWLKHSVAEPLLPSLLVTDPNLSESAKLGESLPASMYTAYERGSEMFVKLADPTADNSGRFATAEDRWLAFKAVLPISCLGMREATPETYLPWARLVERRSDALPPALYDELVHDAAQYAIGEYFGADKRFWLETRDVWRRLLKARNPCYRLLALSEAQRFLEGAELVSAYRQALKEQNGVFHIYALYRLGNIGGDDARKVIEEYLRSDVKVEDRTFDLRGEALGILDLMQQRGDGTGK